MSADAPKISTVDDEAFYAMTTGTKIRTGISLLILGAGILYWSSTSVKPSENPNLRLKTSSEHQIAQALGLLSLDGADRVDLLLMHDEAGCMLWGRVVGPKDAFDKWLSKSALMSPANVDEVADGWLGVSLKQTWWDLGILTLSDKAFIVGADNNRIEIAIRIVGDNAYAYVCRSSDPGILPTELVNDLLSKPDVNPHRLFPIQGEDRYAWWKR